LMLGLDGFDISLAERFIQEGRMPNFARIRSGGASFDLDHGRDKYSGLAWEHMSAGISPSDGARWSAVTFHKKTYTVTQDSTKVRPLLADLTGVRSIVFDFPYFDLHRAPNVRGITAWGAHDPGVSHASRPAGLHAEMEARLGPYPAPEWIYGFCWPSSQKAQAAGEALSRATRVRSEAARWVLQERLPDWDLGVVVISECHSSIEPLWHGIDENHPLHRVESAPAAAEGLRKVYSAVDELIGQFQVSFPDAVLILVAMHGMGPNESDVPAMALLPELLYRFAFGEPYMRPVQVDATLPDGTPLLRENDSWVEVLSKAVPIPPPSIAERLARRLQRSFGVEPTVNLRWMPAARYVAFWPKMKAFALPSFYDGRVRINVIGRESRGKVPVSEYSKMRDQVAETLLECRNLLDGKPVVSEIHCPNDNPEDVGPSEADIYIVWKGAPLGFLHPRFGSIGPLPYLRTGGHTGRYGFLTVAGTGIPSGHYGVASSFDVVPTVIELLGQSPLPGRSGKSLVPRLDPARVAN
jgi:predicted AlkP superfamily phosphohydrolase/phosphomutase